MKVNDSIIFYRKMGVASTLEKIPNQVDETYYTIDIGCSTDVALMRKQYDWQKVFDYFQSYANLKATFATKYPTRF
jgi:DNA repair photolyase